MRKVAAAFVTLVLVASACTNTSEPDRRPAGPSPSTASGPPFMRSACALQAAFVERIDRGYFPGRSPDIMVVPDEPNFFAATTHSGPWAYLQDVPLVLYGPGFIREQGAISVPREVTLADLAPTFAELLDMPWGPDRPGRVLTEALLPANQRAGRTPRLIVTIVWDGGGDNVLQTWPDSWPHLKELMQKGTSIDNATVGSSPTVTPAVHATIGTGAFPDQHAIVDIPVRIDGRITGSWQDDSPAHLELPTLADLYDQKTNNEAEIGLFAYEAWHLGMIGHGADIDGGDKDLAVITTRTSGQLITNSEFYTLPSYLYDVGGFEEDVHATDLADGKLDSTWMGNDILNDPAEVKMTPAWILYQTRLLKEMLQTEGFGRDDVSDLFFTNYKQIDKAGHTFRIGGEEIGELVRYTDDALAELVDFLDAEVGPSQYVLALTADHGQAPDLDDTGAWPIRMLELQDHIAQQFGVDRQQLFAYDRPIGFWLNKDTIAADDIAIPEVAEAFLDYRLRDELRAGEELTGQYRGRGDEHLFASSFPSRRLAQIRDCTGATP
jgi:hypothetical protein